MNTKEKIISEALNLFSIKGFQAISVRDIASAVGIKASSLYNHFENKQDIFDTIVKKYSEQVNRFFEQIKIANGIDKGMSNNIIYISDEQFLEISMNIFEFYLGNEHIVKFRKMIAIEQFNDSKLSSLYHTIFIDYILDFQSIIFSILINANIFIKKNPYFLAIQFYSPVFLLFNKHESVTDEERISFKNYIFDFEDTYKAYSEK